MADLSIEFPSVSNAEVNLYANSLADAIQDSDRNMNVDRVKPNADTQDYGTILHVVLGAASVNATAVGIAASLPRNSGCTLIRFKSPFALSWLEENSSCDQSHVISQTSRLATNMSALQALTGLDLDYPFSQEEN
jgi:hypothetical protein